VKKKRGKRENVLPPGLSLLSCLPYLGGERRGGEKKWEEGEEKAMCLGFGGKGG